MPRRTGFLAAYAALWVVGCTGSPQANLETSHIPIRVQGAVDRGPVSPDEAVDVVVGFHLRNPDALKALLSALDSKDDRAPAKFVSPDQFADRFGAAAADYAEVMGWLGAHELEPVRASVGRTTITVHGTAGSIGRAFATELHVYEDTQGSFRAPAQEPVFAGPLVGRVALSGLDTATPWGVHSMRMDDPPGIAPKAKQPVDLQKMYGADQVMQKGEGETIAILGAGLPPDPVADVAAFRSHYNMPPLAVDQYRQELVGGPTRDGAGAMDEYVENVLDIDMVLALAPNVNVVHVITATNGPGLFTDGISYIVNQLPQAHAVTVSYGSCERVSASEMLVMNALFAQAKAQGQQWFFASGDSGTDGCRDGIGNHVLSVGWPASSPYVVGVGGTDIRPGQTVEEAWRGGGGGQSEAFDKPAYQMGIGPFASDGAREEPDVAAMAGYPGLEIIMAGRPSAVGGTSAATPMWAAIWMLIDQAQGGHGLPGGLEQLYTLGKAGVGFHDVTTGQNPGTGTLGFAAGPGFDLATGWGTPDVPALIQSWGRN